MVPLEESDVAASLTDHGLLLPESADMRQLLQTPMMLSLFIQTAKNTGAQVSCQSREELIDGYLGALCRKAALDEGRAVDYRVEAAVRLVLPAIAREIRHRGRPLNDQDLYRVVGRCHRVIRGRALSWAFPEWIGHSSEVLSDGAQSAEAWHGEIVQRILWQQLGLLVRGEGGCYYILHQILEEHLIGQAAENDRRIRGRKVRAGQLTVMAVVVMACMGLFAYETWLKPHSYDERMSIVVMDAMTMQYVNCGLQYEAMKSMLSGEMEPETCAERVGELGEPVTQTAQLAIAALMEADADVIPWSGEPLDFDSAGALMALPEERQAEYDRYIQAYQRVLQGGTGTSTTEAEFVSALSRLLEADADVAWLLERQAAAPHVAGMSEEQRLSYETGLLSLPAAQENRTVDTFRGLSYALKKAKETRQLARTILIAWP
ncbi:MAG: hypothetical protein ACI4MF_13200 [Candidatus Faecivicinus sp.]